MKSKFKSGDVILVNNMDTLFFWEAKSPIILEIEFYKKESLYRGNGYYQVKPIFMGHNVLYNGSMSINGEDIDKNGIKINNLDLVKILYA